MERYIPPRIIGFTGRKGAGKDTLAAAIKSELGQDDLDVITFQFAGPIKAFCRAVFGWSEAHTDGELKETVDPRWGITPRRAMQTLGTEWGRGLHPNLWVESMRDRVKAAPYDVILITDVRFDNEAEMIREMGGVVVEVFRPRAVTHSGPVKRFCLRVLSWIGFARTDRHASEAGVHRHLIDYTADNSGTREQLEAQAPEILRFLAGVRR